MFHRIHPTELLRHNFSDTKATFLDLKISISNGKICKKIYVKQDEFDFDILVNFTFLDGDVPQCPMYGVYISEPEHFLM